MEGAERHRALQQLGGALGLLQVRRGISAARRYSVRASAGMRRGASISSSVASSVHSPVDSRQRINRSEEPGSPRSSLSASSGAPRSRYSSARWRVGVGGGPLGAQPLQRLFGGERVAPGLLQRRQGAQRLAAPRLHGRRFLDGAAVGLARAGGVVQAIALERAQRRRELRAHAPIAARLRDAMVHLAQLARRLLGIALTRIEAERRLGAARVERQRLLGSGATA